MRDFMSTIEIRRAISPAAAVADNTALVTQIIDLAGYDGCVFAINIGALADADATFGVTIEHGDTANLADTAAVPAAQLDGTLALASFTFAEDNKMRKLGYRGSKRYVRLTITPANNGGNAFIDAVAILFGGRYMPAANPPA